MRRRQFITFLGGAAAAWPLAARAQQPMPVIGVLNASTPDENDANNLVAMRQGLRDTGYVEGRNLTIEYRYADEYRYAENQYDRLPALAADLVRRRVAVIFASGGGVAAPAAKAATTAIPIVFSQGFDPVQSGLVSSLNRPGGNITGVSFAANLAEAKKPGLLHTVVPHATAIGVLMNPDNASVETQSRDLNEAARVLGLKLPFAFARNEGEFEPAFASVVQQGAGGIVVAADVFFSRRIAQLVELAARHAIPAIYGTVSDVRGAAAAGRLMSYGAGAAGCSIIRQFGAFLIIVQVAVVDCEVIEGHDSRLNGTMPFCLPDTQHCKPGQHSRVSGLTIASLPVLLGVVILDSSHLIQAACVRPSRASIRGPSSARATSSTRPARRLCLTWRSFVC